MDLRLGAQGLSQSVARLARQADAASPQDDGGHENVKLVEEARLKKGGERGRSAFHEHAPEAARGQRTLELAQKHAEHCGRIECRATLQRHLLDARRERGVDAGSAQHQPARAIVREAARGRIDASGRIDHHPRGTGAGDPAHRQQGIVGADRAHPDDHRIDAGAQRVQMIERMRAVDIFGFA